MPEPKIDKRSKAYRDSLKNPQITQQIIDAINAGDASKVQDLMEKEISELLVADLPDSYIEAIDLIQVDDNLDPLGHIEIVQSVNQEPKHNIMLQDTLVQEVPQLKRMRNKISIKPFIAMGEIRDEKMGLDEQKLAIFPGTHQIDRIGLYTRNGFKTYITGLDEQAPEVQLLPTEKRLAKIKSIREVVTFLENTIANNYTLVASTCMDAYGTKDDTFWKNVTMFNSSGPDKFDAKGDRIPTYWDKVELQVSNDERELDLKNPHDLVIVHAIEARGLSLVAPSLQWAIDHPGYNFYLDQPEETSSIKTAYMKLKFKAAGALSAMYENDHTRLFLTAKMVVPTGSSHYRRGGPSYTPNDQLYEDIGNYIEGKLGDDTRIAVERILEFSKIPTDELMRKAVIKDALELQIIQPRGDGNFYYADKGLYLGKTLEDMAEYMKESMNSEVWKALRDTVEAHWAV